MAHPETRLFNEMAQSSVDEALLNEYLGFVPDAWLEDVYNACDDHVSDGMDAFEAALKATLRALPVPAGASGAAAAGARKAAAGVEIAEVGEGTDALTQAILDAHGKPGDMAHVYCMRNVFFVQAKYDAALRAAVDQQRASGAARGAALRAYTAAEEDALDTRLAALEASIMTERRRRWALLHRKKEAERSLADATEAEAGLRAVADALQLAAGRDGEGDHDGATSDDGGDDSEGGGKVGVAALLSRVQVARGLSEHLAVILSRAATQAPEPARLGQQQAAAASRTKPLASAAPAPVAASAAGHAPSFLDFPLPGVSRVTQAALSRGPAAATMPAALPGAPALLPPLGQQLPVQPPSPNLLRQPGAPPATSLLEQFALDSASIGALHGP